MECRSKPADRHTRQSLLERPLVNQNTVLRSMAMFLYPDLLWVHPSPSVFDSRSQVPYLLYNYCFSLFFSVHLFDRVFVINKLRNVLRTKFVYSFSVIITLFTHEGRIVTGRPDNMLKALVHFWPLCVLSVVIHGFRAPILQTLPLTWFGQNKQHSATKVKHTGKRKIVFFKQSSLGNMSFLLSTN